MFNSSCCSKTLYICLFLNNIILSIYCMMLMPHFLISYFYFLVFVPHTLHLLYDVDASNVINLMMDYIRRLAQNLRYLRTRVFSNFFSSDSNQNFFYSNELITLKYYNPWFYLKMQATVNYFQRLCKKISVPCFS